MKKKDNLSYEEQADLLIKIGNLLQRGYTVSESIELFLKYEKNKLKRTLILILHELEAGRTFSTALIKLQIPKSIISFVFFAEHYGNLAMGLIEAGNSLKKLEKNKKKLISLLKYPFFLIWTLVIFLILLYHYLFPQFNLLFSSMDLELPYITKILLISIELLPTTIMVISLTIIVSYFCVVISFRIKNEIEKANILSKIPVFGQYYRLIMTYYFTLNLSYLIKSGMSIFEALSLFTTQENKTYIGEVSLQIISKLKSGEKLNEAILSETIYLIELAHVVEHSQANGRLGDELEHYSRWILNELENHLKKVFMILQPLLFCIIGFIVLIMFTSILLPIFSIVEGL